MLAEIKKTMSFINNHPLASRQKINAWGRWLSWQTKSRLSHGPHIVPWVENSVLSVERGMAGATGNIYCGLHEFIDMAFLLHFFRGQPGLFLDIGANIGSYSVLAGKVCKARAIAIEPVPSTVLRLKRNIQCNNITELVEVHEVVAGSGLGSVFFSTDKDTTNQVVDIHYSGQKAGCSVKTVDEILGSRVSEFWKIDVEGHEEEVLCGAEKSLGMNQLHVVLLEGDNPRISKILNSFGFEKCSYEPFARTLKRVPTERHSENYVWVRNIREVERRCRQAPEVHVYSQKI